MESTLNITEATLDKYRHINVEHIDWWDCVYETFREDMKEHGIDVERMYFRAFGHRVMVLASRVVLRTGIYS